MMHRDTLELVGIDWAATFIRKKVLTALAVDDVTQWAFSRSYYSIYSVYSCFNVRVEAAIQLPLWL